MPDLGKYAVEVLSAYAVSLVLLAAIIVASIVQARATKKRLEAAEHRRAAAPAPETNDDAGSTERVHG